MKKYDDVKVELGKKLAQLEQRLAKITSDVRHVDEPLAKDFEEQAIQTENDQVLDFLGNAARTEITLLKRAITRIEHGDYETCRLCGEPIGEERLKALPYADLCINCASRETEIKK